LPQCGFCTGAVFWQFQPHSPRKTFLRATSEKFSESPLGKLFHSTRLGKLF
jgi:hypothetical protein